MSGEFYNNDESSVIVFYHDIMKSNSEKEMIKYRQRLKHIKLVTLKGEYEPFLFSVYCKEVCEDLRIDISALKAKNNMEVKIDNKNIEISRLKMGKALYSVRDWIINPAESIMEEKVKSAYYWLSVYIPEETFPGSYQSELTVSHGNIETIQIPIEVQVLPVKLEDPKDIQFALLYTVSPFGQYYKPRKYEQLAPAVLEFYEELKSHGMTAISPRNSDWPYRKGNIEGLKAEVKVAVKAGFQGPILWYMSSLINGAKGGKRYAHYDGKCDTWEEERDIANLKEIVMTVKEIEKKEKWPEVIFMTVDEPGTMTENRELLNLRMNILEKTLRTVHDLGAKGAVTITEPLDVKHNNKPFVKVRDDLRKRWEEVRPYASIRIYGYGYPQGITNLYNEKADALQRGHKMWFYNNKATMGNDRYIARLFYGFWGWKIGAHGLASWTYPGARTIQWELVREGIDDHKYLYLIQHLSDALPHNDQRRSDAEIYLKEIFNSIELDSDGYIKNWDDWKRFNFVEFRERAASIIHQLSQ